MHQLYVKVYRYGYLWHLYVRMKNNYTDADNEYSNCTNGEARLASGTSENEGRIEICYGHVWGTVCDDHWSSADANIVCSQLGFQPHGILYCDYFMLSTRV